MDDAVDAAHLLIAQTKSYERLTRGPPIAHYLLRILPVDDIPHPAIDQKFRVNSIGYITVHAYAVNRFPTYKYIIIL